MTWLKVDDRALAGPELGRVSRDARLMHLEALAYSMGYDGTGAIPRASLRRATDAEDIDTLAEELVAADLWTATDGGWQIEYLLDDQITPDEIARQKDYHRTRQERHRKHVRGDHSMCDPRYCREATRETSPKRSRDASHDASVTVPRPDPTRPKEGRGTSARSAAASGPAAPRTAPLAREDVSPLAGIPKPVVRNDFDAYDEAMGAAPHGIVYCAVCGGSLSSDDSADASIDGDVYDAHAACAVEMGS